MGPKGFRGDLAKRHIAASCGTAHGLFAPAPCRALVFEPADDGQNRCGGGDRQQRDEKIVGSRRLLGMRDEMAAPAENGGDGKDGAGAGGCCNKQSSKIWPQRRMPLCGFSNAMMARAKSSSPE